MTTTRIPMDMAAYEQQGNRHIHWHVAPLPPGTPYHQQQYYALMAENGIIESTPRQTRELATRLRDALAIQGFPPGSAAISVQNTPELG